MSQSALDRETSLGTFAEETCANMFERIVRAAPEIVEAMIEKAKDGSQQHAKFLFEWAQFEPDFSVPEEEAASPSLAQMLIDKLREDTSESASASTTKVL